MRIVKGAEERKNEILDAASDLFRERGFAGTTPYEAVETVMIYASAVFDDDIVELDETALGRRARALLHNAELLFGVETGAFSALLPIFGPDVAR